MQAKKVKFRAWDKREQKFVDLKVIGFRDREMTGLATRDGENLALVDYDLQQFIGLRDKNETDIYEGDIVHIEDRLKSRGSNWGTDENKPIVFDGGAFRFDGMNLAEMMGWGGYPAKITFEVIGNVYENSNLLN